MQAPVSCAVEPFLPARSTSGLRCSQTPTRGVGWPLRSVVRVSRPFRRWRAERVGIGDPFYVVSGHGCRPADVRGALCASHMPKKIARAVKAIPIEEN
jgi:hypothetical protein